MKEPWKKSSPASIERFGRIVPMSPAVERRTMFGYPCAFVRGNMFGGLFGDDLFVRLPEPERAEFIAHKDGRPLEPVPGRIMKDYVVLAPKIAADEEAAKALFRRSLAHVQTLPEKLKPVGKAKRRA